GTRLFEAGLDSERPKVLRIRHGKHANQQLFFLSLGTLQRETRPMERREAGNLLSTRARVQPRQNDGCLEDRAGLLRKEFRSISISAIPGAGIPEIPSICAVVPEYGSVCGRHRVHRTAEETG